MEWLRLSKNTEGPRYFETESGKAINLFGMARCQSCCNTETLLHGDAGAVAAHFKNLKCNIIRLAIHVHGDSGERGNMPTCDLIEMCGGYNPEGINKFIDTFVNPDVQLIKKQGVYIQLDLHDYPVPQDDAGIVQYARERYIPIWIELAKRYKDDPQIAVFELWNEPYPADVATALRDSSDWVKSIREFFYEIVREVRKIDQKHIIMASDYNAGWGCAWETCWKDYQKSLDEFNNTCFSIHVSNKQLEDEHPNYEEWLCRMADENNVSLFMGEIETEPGIQTVGGMKNLVAFLQNTADKYHFPAVLWRPHGDEANYVDIWRDAVAEYTANTIEW